MVSKSVIKSGKLQKTEEKHSAALDEFLKQKLNMGC